VVVINEQLVDTTFQSKRHESSLAPALEDQVSHYKPITLHMQN